ncbi:MAG: restriction endonuclease [Actinomycetota bacterium]|nr:restriction endonuclease [Actinomycetota bacterium]
MQNGGVTITDWEDYQERVAHLFRELGCSAEVGISVPGVRGVHAIDVWVVFERFGLEQRWAVECKLWKDRPILKEKVLTFKSIVDDVGADKGIFVAEFGFQSGAINAANSTNILLTKFADLQAQAKNEIQSILLERLERKFLALDSRIQSLGEWEEYGQGAIHRFHPGVDGHGCMRMRGRLAVLDSGFRSVKREELPAVVWIDDFDKPAWATNREEFIEMAGQALEIVEAWVAEQEIAIENGRQGRN